MKYKTIKSLIAGIVLATTSASLQADEVWNTNVGEFVYADEIGPTAVWTFGTKENPGEVYILGLSKVYSNRGTYDGYWTRTDSRVKCRTQRMGPNQKMTYFWGNFQIHFVDKDFPSRWVARWSFCNAGPQEMIIKAEPVVGDSGK